MPFQLTRSYASEMDTFFMHFAFVNDIHLFLVIDIFKMFKQLMYVKIPHQDFFLENL